MSKTIKGGVYVAHLREAAFGVTDITLLSIEEAEALPREIRDIGDWWWLRSPGVQDGYTAFVGMKEIGDVSVHDDDTYVPVALSPGRMGWIFQRRMAHLRAYP